VKSVSRESDDTNNLALIGPVASYGSSNIGLENNKTSSLPSTDA